MSNCSVCQSVITSNRRGKKYCSIACKQRAYNARKNGVDTVFDFKTMHCYDQVILVLGESYHISFVEYQYVLSLSVFRNCKTINEVETSLRLIIDDAFSTPESEKLFYKNLNLFRDKYYKPCFE